MSDETMMEEEQQGETVAIPNELAEVEETEDGGAFVRLEEMALSQEQRLAHFANIVEEVDQNKLNTAIIDLVDKISKDKESREKRDKQYELGLQRTGLGDDAPGGAQFEGANRVVHPMLIQACVDFSARFMKEAFPSNGPVKSKVQGEQTPDKLEKARRKTDFMNWQTTEQMPEFRAELEQLSTQLPLGGGQYMKFMWDSLHRKPQSEFIPIDDVYLPFAATNFYTAERKTHVQYITKMEYERRVKSGMYIDVDLGYPNEPEFSKATTANDKIEGKQESSYNEDGLRTIFEIYTFMDFDDGLEPYILTIDKTTNKALSLYRNWEADDEMKNELDWIVEFPFVPWRGAYPIGLTQMIGGLSGAATGALRALMDSAHIQNIPTMLKLKGGPSGQTISLQPTEIAEIEGGAMVDDIRKIAMPLPFSGPSPTLFQLLGFLVDAGRGVVQTSFEKLSDTNPNMPVGTTMALIEQGMVVFSSIHSRLHSSMERCFKILHRINSAYMVDEDLQGNEAGLEIEPADFDGPMDVIPVSDPAIFSETQRFAQIQAIMERARLMPQMYDARKVEEMFLRVMKVPDSEVLVDQPGTENLDPVSENVAAALGRPVYVLPEQDHLAHMMTHLPFLKSPLFGANPAIMPNFLYPMAIHLRDHLLNYYLVEAHTAVQQAQAQNLVQKEASDEVTVIMQVQQFIEQQLGNFGKDLAQMTAEAQKYAPQPPMPQDKSLEIAQMTLQQRAESDRAKIQQDQMELQAKMQLEKDKMELKATEMMNEDQLEAAKIENDIADRQAKFDLEAIKQENENRRKAEDLAARERMNESDNETAKLLAAAEMATGEKVRVSTGTGIDPDPQP